MKKRLGDFLRDRLLLQSFVYSFFGCLLSLGTLLLPQYTISSRFTVPEISAPEECLFVGPEWNCEDRRGPTPQMDGGASVWQDIPALFFYHDHRFEEQPLWNPYIGSGYPIALDGNQRYHSPSVQILKYFPGDKGRDVWIFLLFFLWTSGIVYCLRLLEIQGRQLFVFGFFATLIPYAAMYVDISFLYSDLMAPWIYALYLRFFNSKCRDSNTYLGFALLGLWVGAQPFVQSLVVFGFSVGFLGLFLLPRIKQKSIYAILSFSIPFLLVSLPYVLEFAKFFEDFVSNRSFTTCYSNSGVGLQTLWQESFLRFGKEPELRTLFTVFSLPFFLWGVHRNQSFRKFFPFLLFLILWFLFGSYEILCRFPGLNSIVYWRHQLPHLQILFYVGTCLGFSQFLQKKNGWFFLKCLIVLFSLRTITRWHMISLNHFQGKWPRSAEFVPDPIAEKNIYGSIQKLSQSEDRRHMALDLRLYPNFSSVLKILDLRVLYGVYPRRFHLLNERLYKDWYEVPASGHPDRFTGTKPEAPKRLQVGLEKLLVLHRVSLLSFSRHENWIENATLYNEKNCLKQKEDELAVAYFCPRIGPIGYFPRQVVGFNSIHSALQLIEKMSPDRLIDFAVVENESFKDNEVLQPGQGKILNFVKKPNRLVYELLVEKEGLFVLTDNFFPGWKVLVNGEKSEILAANIAFKSVFVPKGKVTLQFDFSLQK